MTFRQRITRRLLLPSIFISLAILYAQSDQDPLTGLDTYTQEAMAEWELPGLAIAVVKDDQVVYARGFGVRELGRPGQVDEHTLFAIASHTKAFTATAVGMLVLEDQLSWDDRVVDLFPSFQLYDPFTTREITVRDLLTHRQGYNTWAGDLMWWASDLDRQDVIRHLRYLEPDFSFRSRYGYNNMMYITAGELIPHLTGTSWDDFVTTRLLQPLGMNRTTTTIREFDQLGNVATPHMKADDRIIVIPYRNVDNCGPAASLNSSAWDMAQWLRLQLTYGNRNGVQLVDSTVIRETRIPQTPIRISALYQQRFPSTHFVAYGLGWNLQDYKGQLVMRHGGGMDGMLSYTILVPEANMGVTVLTNYDAQSLYFALAWYVVDAFLGGDRKDWSSIYLARAEEQERKRAADQLERENSRAKKSKPTLQLKDYTGTYRNEYYGTAEITREKGRLVLSLQHHPGVQGHLEHWQYDTFNCDWGQSMWGESLVTFTLDAAGDVTTLAFKVREDFIDPNEYVFKRAP
jgi:CubicO group peptidase (beta-lactamase class C family)